MQNSDNIYLANLIEKAITTISDIDDELEDDFYESEKKLENIKEIITEFYDFVSLTKEERENELIRLNNLELLSILS